MYSHDIILAQYVGGNMLNLGEDYSTDSCNSDLQNDVSSIVESLDQSF